MKRVRDERGNRIKPKSKYQVILILRDAKKELSLLMKDYRDIKQIYWVSSVLIKAIQDERIKRQLEGVKSNV